MKIKKIITLFLALSMTFSMACTNAFADNETYIKGQYGYKYISNIIIY